ncbi:competence protein ComFB [Clostridium amylolyticum]|uniref:Competence protein ComFB n=1 Tax=Clostridium amylolyticum TaxID=1121298 RepID=A0A1M6I445_9CLOT|nr:late competence development ComFB family protein [Clostridium amylolyticum]SHJ29202.1 competence protein ComFB [Clostridium amylolyticum]
MIKNYIEDVVERLVPEILNEYTDICKCPMCVEDIKAIALNRIPPKYSVSEKGLLYIKTNELITQFKMDIVKEIVIAINIVSENPRHA